MAELKMNYCMQCGTKLTEKFLEGEGNIPYCETCHEFRFPIFNTAVSMIVLNETKDRVILIRQYGGADFILVAGYVNKGEDAEDAARREVKEELGLDVDSVKFNRSHYFARSNTLMLNFTVTVEGTEPHPNREVDSYEWMSLDEARVKIRPKSLARDFLNGYLDGTYPF